MTRETFAAEFARGMRFVLQKHERELAARSTYYSAGTRGIGRAKQCLDHAETMTDAAVQQVGDHLFDAITQMTAIPVVAS